MSIQTIASLAVVLTLLAFGMLSILLKLNNLQEWRLRFDEKNKEVESQQEVLLAANARVKVIYENSSKEFLSNRIESKEMDTVRIDVLEATSAIRYNYLHATQELKHIKEELNKRAMVLNLQLLALGVFVLVFGSLNEITATPIAPFPALQATAVLVAAFSSWIIYKKMTILDKVNYMLEKARFRDAGWDK